MDRQSKDPSGLETRFPRNGEGIKKRRFNYLRLRRLQRGNIREFGKAKQLRYKLNSTSTNLDFRSHREAVKEVETDFALSDDIQAYPLRQNPKEVCALMKRRLITA